MKATAESRKTGEFRHIDRQAFLNALPGLRSRLDHIAPPVAPPERFDESSLSSEERHSLTRLRQRLNAARAKRESVLREAQTAERTAAAQTHTSHRLLGRINKVRLQFSERLKSLEKALAYAEHKQAAESARGQRLLQKANEMQAHEAEIEQALIRQFSESKKSQAEALARQLEEARQVLPSLVLPSPGAGAGGRVTKFRDLARRIQGSAANAASSSPDTACYRDAELIAESIVADIEGGLLDRIDGAIRFNDLAERKHIPKDIRIAVTRDFFSHS